MRQVPRSGCGALATMRDMFRGFAVFALASLIGGSASAQAEHSYPSTFYLHAGAAGLFYDESARMTMAGVRVPGATISTGDVATPAVELGYYFTPNIAASVTAGFPPVNKVKGAGTAVGMGTLGKAQGGPAGASIHYHFTGLGSFQPYIGAGVATMLVFRDSDGAMQGLNTRNTIGPMVQAGFDLMLDDRWGVFVDVKKAFLTTVSTGTVGGIPAKARVSLDPLVVHSGLTFRW